MATKKTKKSSKHKSKAKFCLVQWLEEDTVSVIPVTTAENEGNVYVGAIESFKWYGQYYDGEVLSISGESLLAPLLLFLFEM